MEGRDVKPRADVGEGLGMDSWINAQGRGGGGPLPDS